MASRIVIVLAFILGISVPIQSQPSVDFGFSQSSFSGIERGESYKVGVQFFSGGITTGFFFTLSLDLSGTASSSDVSLATTRGRFLPFDVLIDVEFSLTVDNIAQESNETFAIVLHTNHFGASATLRDRLEVVIIDSDVITFQLSESDYTQNEEPNALMEVLITKESGILLANPVYFRITPLTVEDALARGIIGSEFVRDNPDNLFSPNRANYKDFNNSVQYVKFPTDKDFVEITIPIVDDDIDEADQQLFIIFLEVVNATSLKNLNILENQEISVGRIKDDEIIRIGFEFESYKVTEPCPGDENVISYLVYLIKEDNQTTEQTYSVDFTVGDPGGNYKPATLETSDINESFDYSFGSPGLTKVNVLFPPTVDRIAFVFSVNPDLALEGTEYFRVTSAPVTPSGDLPVFQTPSGVTAFATTLICIIDKYYELSVGFEELSYTVSESAGTVEVCVVVISPPPTDDLCVTVTLSPSTIDGTAEAGSDFTQLTAFLSTILVIPSSPGSPTAGPRRECFDVTITDDGLFENTESFSLLLQEDIFISQTGATINPNLTKVFILDEDVVSINYDPIVYNVIEGMSATLRLVLNTTSTKIVTVQINSVDGSATAPVDYTPNITTITFPAGTTTQEISFMTVEDSIHERLESFTTILSNPVGGRLGSEGIATVIIADDDDLFVNFDPTMYSVTEDESAELSIFLSTQSDHEVTVQFSTVDGSATAPEDYTSIRTTITFPAGSTVQKVPVPTIDDDINEELEEFRVQLSSPSDALMLGSDISAQIDIIDNNSLSVQFVPATYLVQEGGIVQLIAVLNRKADRPVSVGFNTFDDTAEAPDDYEAVNRIITFPAGETTVKINVSTAEDQVAEAKEIFYALLGNPMDGLLLGANSYAISEILDNDMVSINFAPIEYNVTEGTSATLQLVLSTTSTEVVTVNLTTLDRTASAPGDYIFIMTTIVFPAGSMSQEVSVQTVGDTIHERLESFTAILSNPVGGELGSERIATVIIADDDGVTIGFEHITYSVDEGNVAEVCAVLTGTLENTLEVFVNSSSGSATVEDYNPVFEKLTFGPTSNHTCFNFTTLVDEILEENIEDMHLHLSTMALNVILDPFLAHVHILDDAGTTGPTILTIDNTTSNNQSNVIAIAGAVVLLVVAMVIIVIVMILALRCRHSALKLQNNNKSEPLPAIKLSSITGEAVEEDLDSHAYDDIYKYNETNSRPTATHPPTLPPMPTSRNSGYNLTTCPAYAPINIRNIPSMKDRQYEMVVNTKPAIPPASGNGEYKLTTCPAYASTNRPNEETENTTMRL